MIKFENLQFISVVGTCIDAFAKRKDAEDKAVHYCKKGLKTAVLECKIVAVHNPTKKAALRRENGSKEANRMTKSASSRNGALVTFTRGSNRRLYVRTHDGVKGNYTNLDEVVDVVRNGKDIHALFKDKEAVVQLLLDAIVRQNKIEQLVTKQLLIDILRGKHKPI